MALQPSDKHYRNTVLRLPDLTVTESVLEGLTFENCELIGPAVVIPLGRTEIVNCSWDGEPDSLFWTIGKGRDSVVGAIGLSNCRIVGCRFRNVGLAVPEDQLAEVRRGFGL